MSSPVGHIGFLVYFLNSVQLWFTPLFVAGIYITCFGLIGLRRYTGWSYKAAATAAGALQHAHVQFYGFAG
jgi:hypothetical protein